MNTDLIQPKKGNGKLIIGELELDCAWAALGIANFEPTSNQKGFILVKTSKEMYAFVGNKPFQKIINGLEVKPTTISESGSWQWQLAVMRMVRITSNNESVEFQGEILADRLKGIEDAYISVQGTIKSGELANSTVDFKFKQIEELPPITNQKLNL